MEKPMRRFLSVCLVPLTACLNLIEAVPARAATPFPTATPIKHVVVIFNENISFDHYFGTYPNALNLPGEPVFIANSNTPAVNGLSHELLAANPNFLNITDNQSGAVNPFRLTIAQARTADQSHSYNTEQIAYNNGAMNKFPNAVGRSGPPPGSPAQALTTGLTMGYYDGNTVTAFWNYAQHFAMSDNHFDTVFGPS